MIVAVDRDVAAAAGLLVARYGSKAKLRAALRAGKLHAPRDVAARQLWLEVVRAIDELQRPEERVTRRAG
jgi:hypothetical protein